MHFDALLNIMMHCYSCVITDRFFPFAIQGINALSVCGTGRFHFGLIRCALGLCRRLRAVSGKTIVLPTLADRKTYRGFATASTNLFCLPAKKGSQQSAHSSPKRKTDLLVGFCFGGSGWIRTTEVEDNRFTVCPLWPLGNTPIFNFCALLSAKWSWWTDLNPRPADYKSAALPTELHQQILSAYILYHEQAQMSTVFLIIFLFGFIRFILPKQSAAHL